MLSRLLRSCLVLAFSTFSAAALARQGAPAAGGPATPPQTLPLKATRTHEFTTTKGTWISLDISPDGQSIVFDMLGQLYTLPIAGGTAKAITNGLAYNSQPRFSRAGKKIVFISDHSGGDNVWTMSLDLKDTAQITKGTDNGYTSPAWTPDGKYIVVTKAGGGLGGPGKLWMYNVDGGNGINLLPTAPPTQKTVGAAFGPNARYIWYAARTGDWQYNAVGPQYQLWVYDRENGKSTEMTTRYGSGFRPALSPDGKFLVYASRYDTKTGLRLRNLDTQAEEWLAYPVQRDETESRAPLDAYPGYSFTPDSKAIVVSYGGEIWRVPVDKTAPVKIPFTANVKMAMGPEVRFTYRVDTTGTFTAHQVRDIAPSPDGKKLAFTALDRVWVMDLPSGKPARVSTSAVGEYGATWSPDSRSLAYVTWNDAKGGEIMRASWTGSSATATITTLTPTPGLYTEIAWSPAGDRLVPVRGPARELQEAGGAFRGPAASDFVSIPANGGQPTLIMPTSGLGSPHFTADATRIYAYSRRDGLQSFRWDGTDLKSHLKVTGPLPPGANGADGLGSPLMLHAALVRNESQLSMGGRSAQAVFGDDDPAEPAGPPQPPAAALVLMAPKGDQALAQVGMDLYAVTVPQGGSTAPSVSVANPANASMPVRKLNDIGGEFPAWTSDGRHVMWSLANALWTYDMDRAKVVDDSLKAEAKVKAAAKRDSAAAAAARRDSAGGAGAAPA